MIHTLRPYQVKGKEFLLSRPARLLADQPGLGKTPQTICAVKESGEVMNLVLAPKSVISVWEKEIPLWDQDAVVYVGLGTSKQKQEALRAAAKDVRHRRYYVTNWETLLQSGVTLDAINWGTIVADEVHRIRNRQIKTTRALKKLTTRRKIGLSGTPFSKYPDGLWSTLNWLDKKRWNSYWKFYEKYLTYKDSPWGRQITGLKDNGRLLAKDIQPWVLRRLKSEVLTELPPKQYQYIWTDISKTQYDMYKQLTEDFLSEWDGTTVEAPGVLSRLTRFRQLVVSPSLLDPEFPDDSPRLDAIAEYITDLDEPVVVFSNFVDSLHLLAMRLKKLNSKAKWWIHTGETKTQDKKKYVEEFQAQPANSNGVFLATIPSANLGITLHRASTVVFIDRSWSPIENEQAEDRCHRLGQKDAVNIVIFGIPQTVDARVAKLLDEKHQAFAQVLAADIIGKPPLPRKMNIRE